MPERSILGSMMLAFGGFTLPDDVRQRLTDAPAAGISLYRYGNCESPAQLRALTDAIQACAAPSAPLLLAVDQEGGQLNGVVGSTPFPGAMALGAAGDVELAERVARAVGRELRAVGANVNYAPVCDVASNALNPGIGVRSFGSDPAAVAELAAATVRGLQSVGVAATAKHFPGAGEVVVDTHHGLGAAAVSREHLDAIELLPFRAAVAAGARVVMSGHFAVPALDGADDLPATLSPAVWRLLRHELGFDGVTITDALDMRALAQGPAQVLDVLAALRAGADLLLCAPDREAIQRIEDGLVHAATRRLVDPTALASATARITALRRWVAAFEQPPLSVVGCAEHIELAREVAARSVTLVRNEAGLLPLRLAGDARVLAIMPEPADLTPADTSSTVVPGLAAALRRHHANVDELVVPLMPGPDEIAAVTARAADHDLIVVGTVSASLMPEQATLVRCLLDRPTVTVA
ncbi:MAG TPA: glycoside hydrolase family 3 N-terminal domain-containing protein, partial [Candidatus Limnocylindria bacterium]|nr:glycoside hydrolase family 3 N-terminal domain-containing protein [Candidatus Limnocylindria bacterium]